MKKRKSCQFVVRPKVFSKPNFHCFYQIVSFGSTLKPNTPIFVTTPQKKYYFYNLLFPRLYNVFSKSSTFRMVLSDIFSKIISQWSVTNYFYQTYSILDVRFIEQPIKIIERGKKSV